MDSNNKADSRKILGIETITAFIETEIDPSNLMGIVESENFLEGILDNYLEITSTENTELMSIDDVFELLGKGQPILIRDNSKSDIKNLLAIVETIRAINKKVTRLNTEFDSKLIIDLSNPDNAVWEKLSTFINQKFNSFTNYKLIQNQQIQQKLNHWISETIKKAHLKLEKSLKDFLHSEVNKSIILNKITGTEGWKFKLNDEKKHKSDPLKQYETAIRDEINTLITPYKAPFIEQFSKELFSRCYKQLLSSEKESIMPSKIKTDIQDITQTQLNNLKLEANVKQRFNKEYNDLLKYLLSNKSDIKQYAKNKLSILKSISNDAELSEKEKKDIQSTFFQIYHNIRGYEQENHYWAENAQHLGDSKKGAKERFLFQALEASIHRFRPYVL
ncbi:MAG: hypothetical protein VW397_05060, partial [Candidatus Margulisiibacteriota bacterium]